MLRRLPSLLPLVALILLATLLGSSFSPSGQLDITTGLVQMCIVIGMYAFIGVTGVFSFGHIGFAAVGAYLSGLSAALATFAMLVIVQVIARNYEELTRGTKGVLGVPKETTLWGAAIWAIVCLLVVFVFQNSRFGLQLRAAREDEVAARAMGIHVGVLRGLALVLSAFIVGLAGGVYGQSLGSFNPDVFYLDLTFLTLAMLVVGGVNSLSGAVIGTLVLTFLAQVLRDIEASLDRPGLTEVCFALILILILVLRPSGITGGKEIPLGRPRWPPWRPAEKPPPPSDEPAAAP